MKGASLQEASWRGGRRHSSHRLVVVDSFYRLCRSMIDGSNFKVYAYVNIMGLHRLVKIH